MPANHAPTQNQVDECLEQFQLAIDIAVKALIKKGYTRGEILHIFQVWGSARIRDMLFEAPHA